MRAHKLFFTFILFCLTCFSLNANAQSDPVALLQHVADNMISGLKANQANLKNKPQVVYRLANQYIVPYADIQAMAKRVVPPQTWKSASASQRQQFQREFTTTLIRTYASALSAYNNQSIRFFPIRGATANSVEVRSEISSPESQPIQVSYRLLRSGNDWRLYDLSVEGVSMLESFRSQFADILSQGNMAQLLQRMSQHNQGRRA